MLVELAVENYAVIEKVRVRFHRGLNLLTGETGSGKSIVVDALALLLGGRAPPRWCARARSGRAFREFSRSPRTGAVADLLEEPASRSWRTAN